MKSGKSAKPALFILLAFVMIFTSESLIIGKDKSAKDKDESAKKKKLYITNLKSDDVNKKLLDRIRNGIFNSILENYGEKYNILDDDGVKVMYSQVEKIQASGCTDESCITQIADGINADEIIYGEVNKEGGNIAVAVKCMARKNMELAVKSAVNISFRESQADWFAAETGKKLMQPSYRIDPSKAPAEFDAKVDIKGISIGEIEGVNIKEVEGFGIEAMKFTTSDEAAQKILGYLKDLVKEGDEKYQVNRYEDALEKYLLVIDRIEKRLLAESQEKVSGFKSEVTRRIDTTYRMSFKRDIEKSDKAFKNGKYKNAREGYNAVLENINKVPGIYRSAMNDVTGEVKKRIESTYVMAYRSDVEEIDEKLKSEKEADESFLNKIIGKYKDVKNDFSDVPKDMYADGMVKLAGAVDDRIDSCLVSICSLHEKIGDTAYSEYRFDDAMEQYGKSLAISGKISGSKKDETASRYDKKIMLTRKTGTGYLENKVRSYMDMVEFYNVKDETSGANKKLYEARKYLLGSMRIFATMDAVETYNKVAKLLKTEEISENTEPELIFNIKAKQEYIDGMKGRGYFITENLGNIEMVKLPGGAFMMGRDAHKVMLSPFYIGRYAVTQKQYSEIMESNSSHFKGNDLPVETVNWYDAVEFCNKLSEKQGLKPYYKIDKNTKDKNNTCKDDELKYTVSVAGGNGYRLPTEAEWEYACRAGTRTAYYWGHKKNGDYCWYDGNSGSKTHPVGQKKPNAYGLYDMSGNVSQWCGDWIGDSNTISDPSGSESGMCRIIRGGSWDDDAEVLRSDCRHCSPPDIWSNKIGFRLARSLK